jgi:hypothetical protein
MMIIRGEVHENKNEEIRIAFLMIFEILSFLIGRTRYNVELVK